MMHLLTEYTLTLLKPNFHINHFIHIRLILMLLYTLDYLLLCFFADNFILKMPKRLIESDYQELEKKSLTKKNVRSDLPLLHTQKKDENVTVSPQLPSCNENNANLNINRGKHAEHKTLGYLHSCNASAHLHSCNNNNENLNISQRNQPLHKASPDLDSFNDNNGYLNINQGKQPVYICEEERVFKHHLGSTVNEQTSGKKRKAVTQFNNVNVCPQTNLGNLFYCVI